ncbi:MAG: UDP-N-acetylmuramoyl-tripeptide--D-alanyl-D-alanine ligase [Oscillospiraceae bacterium]|jgi:UDP-N-acetylmuramoyl-tripeptide--D-alanyl-D-alanine ligase
MEPVALGKLLEGVGVTMNPGLVVKAVSTDSRTIEPGSVFVGIKGDRFDGEEFAKAAAAAGASAAVLSRRRQDIGIEQIIVPDTKAALIAMAGNYRKQFSPRVAGVTGSAGKTTTKDMTAAIFSRFGRTLKTEGNFNNEVGVPSTLFRMDRNTELAVVEMGMSGLGEISRLSRAARPDVGIITMIGVSHIEFLRTRENILRAKLEIMDGMPDDGILVINGDDDLLSGAKDRIGRDTATFGIDNTDSDVCARDVKWSNKGTEFRIFDRLNGEFRACIPAIGKVSVLDALAAYTAATRLGLDPAGSAAALSDYVPSGMRQKIVDFKGITLIEDCYNANPDSMKASLAMLSNLEVQGLRIAVLGDMLELGDISEAAHRAIGMWAARCRINVLLCIGDEMRTCAEAARAAGVPCVEHFESKHDLAKYLAETAHDGDAVIFKGSRSMKLEDVISEFRALRS